MTQVGVRISEPCRFSFGEYGALPSTTNEGLRASARLHRELGSKALLLLDFRTVEGVDVAFFDAFFSGMHTALQRMMRKEEYIKALVIGMRQDVQYGVSVMLNHVNVPAIAYQHDETVNLMTEHLPLLETFAAAQELTIEQEQFTAHELANALGQKLSNTNNRLASLAVVGATARFRDNTARRGIRYLYQAVTSADIPEK